MTRPWQLYAEWMRKLYLYLDRNDAIGGMDHRNSTTSIAIQLFKTFVFDAKKVCFVHQHIRSCLLAGVHHPHPLCG